MPELLHQELTGKIIGVYYDVYNGTARTYPEFIYERAMTHDLRTLGVPCDRQDEYETLYKGKRVGLQRLDLFTAGEIVVELKVTAVLTPLHKAQGLSYLKVVGKQVGLLFNFGSPEPEFARLFFEPRQPESEPQAVEQVIDDVPGTLLSPELTYTILGSLYEVHSTLGPGFIYRIYANACYHEFRLQGLDVRPQRELQVYYRQRPIGEIKFAHLRVEDRAMVFPVAVRDLDDISINNLKNWMRAERVPIGIVANFNAISLKPMVLRV